MIMIKVATIVLWAIFTGMIAKYVIYIIKARKEAQERYHEYLINVDANSKLGLEAPAELDPPKTFFTSIITAKTFWVLSFWMITTSGFMMFIVEEACQVLGFGRYGLQSSKLWEEAADAANYSAGFIESSDKLIDAMAMFNPLAGYVFGRYMDAEEKKLQWEMQRIEKELSKQGKRITRIEGELRIRPIAMAMPEVRATGPPSRMPVKPALSYPVQVDYTTHAVRVETQKGMVFTTSTGAKYHKLFCRWLRHGNALDGEVKATVQRVSRADAIAEGLEPCGTCKPR